MTHPPWIIGENQLTLFCHIQPGARRSQLAGLHDNRVKIQLGAAPVDGKANKALIEFLAKLLGQPKSAIRIIKGLRNRRKTVTIQGISQLPVEMIHLQNK